MAPYALILLLSVSIFAAEGKEKGKSPRGDFTDTLFWAPEIVVEAKRIDREEEIFNRSGFVGLIDLRKEELAVPDAAALLSRSVGVRVKQYGGLGSFATLSIRGSSSTQVQFYLDGVPLNDAYSGMTNLADIALDDLQSIEIYRGFSPSGFGASAIGGTVNLVSRGKEEGKGAGAVPRVWAGAAGGSFGTRRYHLRAKAGIGRVLLRAGAGYVGSDGDFTFRDDNGTPRNPLDDDNVTRLNNEFSRLNLNGRIRLDLLAFNDLSLNHNSFSREAGVPGLGANQSTEARFERLRRLSYLKAEPRPVLSGRIHTEGILFYSWSAERFLDPGGDINLAMQETDNRIVTQGGNIRAKLFVFALPARAELFCESKKERFHPVEKLPRLRTGPDRLRKTVTLVLSGEYGAFDERAILTLGRRYQWLENEFYDEPFFPWLPPSPQGRISHRQSAPYFGFRAQPFPFLTLKGNWGRYYRLPTFFEMFGNLGSVTGDSGLLPEEGLNRDLGVIISGGGFWFIGRPFLEAVYLYNEIDNLILFFPNSQATVKPANIGSALIRGCEISLAGNLPHNLRVSGNYSYLNSRDTGPIPYYRGNELSGRPAHEGGLRVEYRGKKTRIVWETHYIGANYIDQANMNRVPARGIHNLTLNLDAPLKGLSFSFEGNNLGGDQTSDVGGYPLPGRIFYTAVKYTH
ncbi:MAG: TonB-dependent receptor [Candidatus Krumholzibacteriota bacterium]|nr:TonB-dependent receptor [Candidatus Krumholzibacteriota bacterium]